MLWIKANPEYDFNLKTPISKIDEILQIERIDENNRKVSYLQDPNTLPDGTFVEFNNEAYLIKSGVMYLWSPGRYGEARQFSGSKLQVLTPKSVVNTFREGYLPKMCLI